MCSITFLAHAMKKLSKNAAGFPSHELADECEYTMPVSEGHAKVTDRAGPEPDQLHIVSICLSLRPCRPPLDEMQADGGVEGVSYN